MMDVEEKGTRREERRGERRDKKEGAKRRKKQRGGSSDVEEGATRRVKKMRISFFLNEEKVARRRIVDPRGLVSILKFIHLSRA